MSILYDVLVDCRCKDMRRTLRYATGDDVMMMYYDDDMLRMFSHYILYSIEDNIVIVVRLLFLAHGQH